jgi:hypothetical protein
LNFLVCPNKIVVNNKNVKNMKFFLSIEVSINGSLRTGLADVGGFEKCPPGTAADALLMYKIR